jgi:predicted metal-dependent hydrolase
MTQYPETHPDELDTAVEQFNNRQWFECHETLEELWFGESGMKRDLYQGILQIAVALYHWNNLNYPGTMKLLKTGVEILDKVDPVFMQVDVAGLSADSRRLREALETLGVEKMAELDDRLIPKIRRTHSAK